MSTTEPADLRAALTQIVTDIDGCPGGEHLRSHVDDLQVLFAAQREKFIEELPKKLTQVPAAEDLYERAQQLGYAEGFNDAIDQFKALLTEGRKKI